MLRLSVWDSILDGVMGVINTACDRVGVMTGSADGRLPLVG